MLYTQDLSIRQYIDRKSVPDYFSCDLPRFSKRAVSAAAADLRSISLRAHLSNCLATALQGTLPSSWLVAVKPLKWFSPTTPPEKIDRVIAKMSG